MSLTTLNELAKELDSFVEANGMGFRIQEAVMYGIKRHAKGGVSFVKSATSRDIYEMLTDNSEALETARTSEAVGIITCGWAAPVNDDNSDSDGELPPSVHPQRRRVRLLIVAKRNLKDIVSVIRFQDEPDNVMTEESEGQGPLAEAIHSLMSRANADAN